MTRLDQVDYRQALLLAALSYANRGWHVFPLRPGTKRPAVPNHPAHLCNQTDPKCVDGHTAWEQRATTDLARITAAWTRRPYGIGIACGPSRLLVVDLDTPTTSGGPPGVETWSRLTHQQPVVHTHVVATPSGGRHLYYHQPEHLDLGNTASRLGPRIDTRASGGYVVAPPTRINDTAYRVTCAAPVAVAPAWLLDALAPPTPAPQQGPSRQHRPPSDGVGPGQSERVNRYVDAALDGSARRLQAVTTKGTRNRTLFEVARSLGQLVGAGLLNQATAERVLWANTTHFVPIGDCTRSELAATITSGLTSGKRLPRQLPTDLTEQTQRTGVSV